MIKNLHILSSNNKVHVFDTALKKKCMLLYNIHNFFFISDTMAHRPHAYGLTGEVQRKVS